MLGSVLPLTSATRAHLCTAFCCRLLRAIDFICLTNSVLISLLVFRTFAATWTKIMLLHALMYGVLVFGDGLGMLQRKELYQRHRFQVSHTSGSSLVQCIVMVLSTGCKIRAQQVT
jgi:hypothetical protein